MKCLKETTLKRMEARTVQDFKKIIRKKNNKKNESKNSSRLKNNKTEKILKMEARTVKD